ncbi:MAG TPA: hypothetical protein P5560_04285 [Thermotogota bacterium]|nr:hypothetical protein [Thermotogota bacterium]
MPSFTRRLSVEDGFYFGRVVAVEFSKAQALYLAVGEQILSGFFLQLLAEKEEVQQVGVQFREGTARFWVKGSWKGIPGTADFDLSLERFSSDLADPETLEFSLLPRNALSRIALTGSQVFQKALRPFVEVRKNHVTVNLPAIVQRWKPQLEPLLHSFRLQLAQIQNEQIQLVLVQLH